MTLVKMLLASGNKDKFEELHSKLSGNVSTELLRPSEFGISLDVDETGSSLHENAELKAVAHFRLLKIAAVADDTGLFVNSLGGEPGIHSARYSGKGATYGSNRKKLLNALKSEHDRTAEFRTVLCLAISEKYKRFFEGTCKGRIAFEESGDQGFGYDSIFIPDGYNITFAEMSPEEKNLISHRGKALDSLISYLRENEFVCTP